MQKLPVGDFRWMNGDELSDLEKKYRSYDVEGDKGLWICADLEYPQSLHDSHGDLPLAPENRKVIFMLINM